MTPCLLPCIYCSTPNEHAWLAQPGCRLSADAAPVPYGLPAGTSRVLTGSHICVSHPLWGAGLTNRQPRRFTGNLMAVAEGDQPPRSLELKPNPPYPCLDLPSDDRV